MTAIFKELDPHQIFRLSEGPRLFGYKPSQIESKIKSKEIPMPLALSATGRARGWTGEQVNQHYRELAEQQPQLLRDRAAANAKRTKKKG